MQSYVLHVYLEVYPTLIKEVYSQTSVPKAAFLNMLIIGVRFTRDSGLTSVD